MLINSNTQSYANQSLSLIAQKIAADLKSIGIFRKQIR
jgi:hypothetical protein